MENSNNLCLQNFGEETPNVEAVSCTKNLLFLLHTYFDYFYIQLRLNADCLNVK